MQSENLSFHIQTGDYFRVLGTIFGFVQETVQECTCGAVVEIPTLESELIQAVRKDLDYLHENYRIVPSGETTA